MASFPVTFPALLGAAYADVDIILSEVDLELLNHPYICEHQPLVIRAIAAARDGLRAASSVWASAGSSLASTAHSFDAVSVFDGAAAMAVRALGSISQAGDISSIATLCALRAVAGIVAALEGILRCIACDGVQLELAAKRGAKQAPTATSTLETAVHAALHVRFEPVSGSDDELVLLTCTDILRSVLLHSGVRIGRGVQSTVLRAALTGLLRTAVDWEQTCRAVQLHAASALLETAPTLFGLALVHSHGDRHRSIPGRALNGPDEGRDDETGRVPSDPADALSSSLQGTALELLHLLCDILGTPRGIGQMSMEAEGGCFLPPGALLPTMIPVQLHASLSDHSRFGDELTHGVVTGGGVRDDGFSGGCGGGVPIAWDAWDASREGKGAQFNLSANGTGEGEGQPAVPRLHVALPGAVPFALRVLSSMLGQMQAAPAPLQAGNDFTARLVHIVRTRVCLPLVWMSDGAGPADCALAFVHPSAWEACAAANGGGGGGGVLAGVFGGSAAPGAASTPRVFRTLAGSPSLPGATATATLTLPRLPLLRSALRVMALIAHAHVLRAACAKEMHEMLMRTILRGLTAPARVVLGAVATSTPPAAMRAVLEHLNERGNQGSADILPLVPAEASAATKAAVGALALASRHSVRGGGQELTRGVSPEAIRALIYLLHSRSGLMSTTAACLDGLHSVLQAHPGLVRDAFQLGDGRVDGHDAIRCMAQTLAALSLGEAHVHAIHGTAAVPVALHSLEAGGGGGAATTGNPPPFGVRHVNGPPPLPLHAAMRTRASETAALLLASYRGRLSLPRTIGEEETEGTARPALLRHLLALRSVQRCKRLLQTCARTFNAKPKRGVEAMKVTGILDMVHAQVACTPSLTPSAGQHTPQHAQHSAVAFALKLYGGPAGFDPVAVGEYLGGGEGADEDAKRRAHAAAYVHDLTGRPLLEGLRVYLSSFRLPGEAQQIDRILQAFAGVAHTVCAEACSLPSIDATYLLAFSCIMLNTDLHNPAIREDRRMSEAAFLRNNVYYGDEICHGRRMPEEALRAMYRALRDTPIAPPPSSFSLISVLAPAADAGPSAVGGASLVAGTGSNININRAAARALTAGADPVGSADWIASCQRSSTATEEHKPESESAALQGCALWVASLPEVWHANVRTALAGFTAAFRVSAAHGPSESDKGRDRETQDIKLAARVHLRTMAQCASHAAEAGMVSGVDIIIAALCRIACHSLKCPYEEAHALVQSQSAGQEGVDGRGSGPGPVDPAYSRGSAFGAIATVLFGSPSPPDPGAPGHTVGEGAGVTSPTPAPSSSALTRHPSLLAMSLTPTTGLPATGREGDEGEDQEESAHTRARVYALMPTTTRHISAHFASDLRAQMALSAALAIAMPESQGHCVGQVGWRWLVTAISRMQRCGLWGLQAALTDALGCSSISSKVEGWGDGPSRSIGLPSLRRLCCAYALAAAQAGYMYRRGVRMSRSAGVKVMQGGGRDGGEGEGEGAGQAHGSGTRSHAPTTSHQGAQGAIDEKGEATGLFSDMLGWIFGGVQEGAEASASATTVEPGPLRGSAARAAGLAQPTLEPVHVPSSADLKADFEADLRDLACLMPPVEEEADDDDGITAAENGMTCGHGFTTTGGGDNTASIEALGANVNILLSAFGQGCPFLPVPLLAALAWCGGLPVVGGPELAEGRIGGREGGGTEEDDGAAFISGMETCRFKCAVLAPPSPPPPRSSRSARSALGLHGAVLGKALAGSSKDERTLTAFARHTRAVRALMSTVADSPTPTLPLPPAPASAHARDAFLSFLDVCAHLLEGGGVEEGGAVPLEEAACEVLSSLHTLCRVGAPLAGMLRLCTVSWILRLAERRPHGFAALALSQGREAKGDGEPSPTPTLAGLLLLVRAPGWLDDGQCSVEKEEEEEQCAGGEQADDGEADEHAHVLEVVAASVARMSVAAATHALHALLGAGAHANAHMQGVQALACLLHTSALHPPCTRTITVHDSCASAVDGLASGLRSCRVQEGGVGTLETFSTLLAAVLRCTADPRPAPRLYAMDALQTCIVHALGLDGLDPALLTCLVECALDCAAALARLAAPGLPVPMPVALASGEATPLRVAREVAGGLTLPLPLSPAPPLVDALADALADALSLVEASWPLARGGGTDARAPGAVTVACERTLLASVQLALTSVHACTLCEEGRAVDVAWLGRMQDRVHGLLSAAQSAADSTSPGSSPPVNCT